MCCGHCVQFSVRTAVDMTKNKIAVMIFIIFVVKLIDLPCQHFHGHYKGPLRALYGCHVGIWVSEGALLVGYTDQENIKIEAVVDVLLNVASALWIL